MPSVAEVVAQALAAYGTEKFFCFMGGDHEFWFALQDAGIELVNCRSEPGAVYMADGYARVSGKPGFVYGQRGRVSPTSPARLRTRGGPRARSFR